MNISSVDQLNLEKKIFTSGAHSLRFAYKFFSMLIELLKNEHNTNKKVHAI